ncbi:hypothetical protein GBAR_LOCUS1803, partial [Geodia barretti]
MEMDGNRIDRESRIHYCLRCVGLRSYPLGNCNTRWISVPNYCQRRPPGVSEKRESSRVP